VPRSERAGAANTTCSTGLSKLSARVRAEHWWWHGEPGVGKTALFDYVVEQAESMSSCLQQVQIVCS
jgi:Cdc6-like AAA superfamily ATPase